MTPIRLLLEADEELRVAAQAYENAQPGLGRAFVDQVRRTISLIAEYPRASRVVRSGLRTRSVARFPYRIYYRVSAEELVVVAVGHRRRRPGFWRMRPEG